MAYNKTIWEGLPSTNTPISASNLNKIENGIYDNSLKADQVGDLTQLDTNEKSSLVGAVNESFYKDNDTYVLTDGTTGRVYLLGLITNVNKDYFFTLKVDKSLKKISSITVNTLKLVLRNSNGNYVEASGYTQGGINFLSSTYNVQVEKLSDYYITFRITKQNDATFTNTTNNSPQIVEIDDLSLTFNESV